MVSAYKDRVLHPTLADHLYKKRKYIKYNFSFNETVLTSTYLESLYGTETDGPRYPKDLIIRKAPEKHRSVSKKMNENKLLAKNKKTKYIQENYKVGNSQILNNQRSDHARPRVRGIIPTFPEFVRFTIEKILKCRGSINCLQNTEPHIAPASSLCPPCLMQFDFIFKVSKLAMHY